MTSLHVPPHPGRRLRALTDWTLRSAALPDGVQGHTDILDAALAEVLAAR